MYDLFYFLGGALTLAAVALAVVGMRSPTFPSSRGLLFAVGGVMVLLVLATTTWAVRLSAHEKSTRLADEAASARSEAANGPGGTDTQTGQEAQQASSAASGQSNSDQSPPAKGETVKLSSPPSGDLLYDTTKLSAKAGSVTIDFTNPSAVPHSVAIKDSSGKQLAAGDTVSGGDQSVATADLKAGKYEYYCTVPGHEQAGMKGTLTVK